MAHGDTEDAGTIARVPTKRADVPDAARPSTDSTDTTRPSEEPRKTNPPAADRSRPREKPAKRTHRPRWQHRRPTATTAHKCVQLTIQVRLAVDYIHPIRPSPPTLGSRPRIITTTRKRAR